MKQLLLLGLLGLHLPLFAQLNTTLRSQLDYDEPVNDIWGYAAPDGTEYAIVGLQTGVSFVSLADPDNAVEVVRVPGVNSSWRDMKIYREFAYSVADEGNEGITAFDLRFLPDSVPFRRNTYEIPGAPRRFERAHNLYVDTASARLFTAGGSRNIIDGGVLIFDLAANPMEPVLIAQGPATYSHDVFVLEDTMYCSEIYDGELAVYDIGDLDNIVELGTATTPGDFTHNAWTTANGQTVFTTDEVGNAPVAAYDLSDKNDITRLYEFRPLGSLGQGTIPHNVHVIDDYLSISYYTDGLRVADASKPDNIIEVANYDTWLGNDGGFNGNWGAYPYLPSGLTLVSDRQSGLFVVDVNYVRAARLEGIIRDPDLGTPINNVVVSIAADQLNAGATDALGRYKTGLATDGTYTVTFTAENYEPLTVEVELVNGVVTTLDTTMTPNRRRFDINLRVVNDATNEPIPDATFRLLTGQEELKRRSDEDGRIVIEKVFEGDYRGYVSEWGYESVALENISSEDLQNEEIRLRPGYMDDFVTDEGWTTDNRAPSGQWERAVPLGTDYFDGEANPGTDVPDDLGDEAYVTGNGGGTAGNDDVDDDLVILASPPFGVLPRQDNDLTVSYQYWLFRAAGNGPLDDTLTVQLTDGAQTVTVRQYTDTIGAWRKDSFRVADYLDATDNLQLIVTAGDLGNWHLVEAGFDNFRVTGAFWAVSTDEPSEDSPVTVFPNPSAGAFTLRQEATVPAGDRLRVLDVTGRLLLEQPIYGTTLTYFGAQLPAGLYFLELLNGPRRVWTGKVVKE
ncbi:MAG: choice-of-anchor B family protein [Bacteroidota bacterium]